MATQEASPKNVLGYFIIQDKKHERLSQFVSGGPGEICGVDPGMKIVASCNQGIVWRVKYLSGGDYCYYVGKPSTRQWVVIPNPKKGNDDEPSSIKGIMILPSFDDSLRFGLVRLTEKKRTVYEWLTSIVAKKKRIEYECEIFDSELWTWDQHKDLTMRNSCETIVHSPGVSSRNSVKWLTSLENAVDILFDEIRGIFKYQYIITQEGKNNKYMKLVECDDGVKLGYIKLTEEGVLQLWILTQGIQETYDNYHYEKRAILFWDRAIKKNLKNHEDQGKHAGFYNVDNLEDLNKFREIICYEKIEDNNSTCTIRLDQLNVAADVFRMRFDFEPINLPQPPLVGIAKKSHNLQIKKRKTRKRKPLKKKVSTEVPKKVSVFLLHSFLFICVLFFGFLCYHQLSSLA